VWSLVVVNPDESIKALLLLKEVEGGGLGGFFLQRQMHALMAAVLLWMSGLDALQFDPESQPPDGECGAAARPLLRGGLRPQAQQCDIVPDC
jgi:hypothetical protein